MAGMSYTMATKIAIDTVSAQQSLKGLNSGLQSSVNAMKAGIAQASSMGDSQGALQAKIDGLGQSINILQDKISVLKDKQSGLNTENSKDAESYLKLQKQIDQAQTRLASYTAKQDQAKQSISYYTSGLSDLQRGYQTTMDKTEAYANRLKAEGDTYGANKAKLGGYKEALTNLSSQYEKQVTELKNNQTKVDDLTNSYNKARNELTHLSQSSDKNSTTYKEQETKVNELKNALDKANNSLDQQKIRVDKTGTSIAETKTKTSELSKEVDKQAPKTFFQSFKDGLTGVNKKTDETTKKSHTMLNVFGGNLLATGIANITSGLQEQAKAGYDDAKAAETFSDKFKNMGASEAQTKQLAGSIKEIKENSNISGGAVTALSQKFYGMTGSAEKTNQLVKGVGSLSDAMHLTQTQADSFANGLGRIEASGKITSQSLTKIEKQAPGLSGAMAKTAGMSTKSFKELLDSGKMTSEQFNDILSKSANNFNENAKKYNSTTDGATHHMQTAWADTRKSLMKPLVSVSSSGLSSLSKALDNPETQKAVEKLGAGIAQLTGKMADMINYLSKHSKDVNKLVGSLVNIVKLIGMGAWDTFKNILVTISNIFNGLTGHAGKSSDKLHGVANAFQAIAKHEKTLKTIGGLLAAAFAVKKLADFTRGVKEVIQTLKLAELATKAWNGVTKVAAGVQWAFNAALNANPIGLVVIGIAALTTGFVLAYKKIKPFHEAVDKFGKKVKDVFGGMVDFIKDVWNEIKKLFKGGSDGILKIWNDSWNGIASFGKNIWNGISGFFKAEWNGFKALFGTTLRLITDLWTGNWSDIGSIGKSIWNGISSFFGGAWNIFKSLFSGTIGFVSSVWSSGWNGISGFAKGIWGGISSAFSGFTGGIKSVWESVTGFLGKLWNDMWSGIKSATDTAVKDVRYAFVSVVRGVISPFNSMLGGIKKGINWILDKVGADSIKANWSIPMPSYANGTKDTHQGGLALVNDAKGSNYREMYRLPNGQIGLFPKQRNMIVPLPKGTSVLNADKSKLLAKMMKLPNYAGGIGDFFGGIWDGAKDILEDVDKVLKNPAKFMESTLNHFMGGISSNIELASQMITHFPSKIASESVNWIKKQFEDMAEPGGSGVERWRSTIKRALGMNGLPTNGAYVNAWLKQIATESSGNPRAVQGDIGDINNATGDLAKGLLQTISSTFNAYAFPGHHNIFNGFDNALSAIHYAKSAYGSDMLGVIGHGHGYANGGYVNNHSMIEVAEGNKGEFIIPTDPNRRNRSLDLLDQANAVLGNNKQETKETANDNHLASEVKSLKQQVSDLIKLQKQMLSVNSQTVKAIYDTAQEPLDRYHMDARNQSIRSSQSLLGGGY